MSRNSCILLKEPTPPINDERDIMRDPSGSVSKVKSDKDVNTVAVSRVLAPSLLSAMMENTAKARIGDTIGEIYAINCQQQATKYLLGDSQKPIVHMSSFLNFLEISSS